VTRYIPVVDIFAGPGGLGEGFSACAREGRNPFRIKLSIEANPVAHSTLQLRSFFRQFGTAVPDDYYRMLEGKMGIGDLYRKHPTQHACAKRDAWRATLGKVSVVKLHARIRDAVNGASRWVLIGGPPCQAYSLIGRSRNGGLRKGDRRVHLYREYLKILAKHAPPVFVMENVKGLLSSKLGDEGIFDLIRRDLQNPSAAVRERGHEGTGDRYRLLALAPSGTSVQLSADGSPSYLPEDFIIKSERFGIPQARHRIIIIGVRTDIDIKRLPPLRQQEPVSVEDVIGDLPRLRSGLSRETDDPQAWMRKVRNILHEGIFRDLRSEGYQDVVEEIRRVVAALHAPRSGRGKEFMEHDDQPNYNPGNWFRSKALKTLCNHSTRGHMESDLHRYLFAACFAKAKKRSPELFDFPPALLPNHENAFDALGGGNFADRFRVQLKDRPSTTVTSHIAKDGHYYIHYDPSQCRSLTVREAARLQTFPDDYFFCGARTAQYAQVGNAVPPLLARQIAERVHEVLTSM
jgi:DNA (cytosine-5)-methyltransferase 1